MRNGVVIVASALVFLVTAVSPAEAGQDSAGEAASVSRVPRASSAQLNAVFTVNNTDDAVDNAPGDGICAASGGACTLRAAVMEANALAGLDTIVVPAGTFVLARSGGDNTAVNGDLDLTGQVNIIGTGRDETIIDGNAIDRAFDMQAGSTATISNLSVRNGRVSGAGGGAIQARGATTLDNVAVLDSTAINVNGSGGSGAGIQSIQGGALTVRNSRIAGNTAVEAIVNGTPSGGSGGGIANFNGSGLTVVNSVIEGNTARNGGGITQNDTGSVLTIRSSSIRGNSALFGAGLITGSSTTAAATTVNVESSTFSGNQTLAGGNTAGIHAGQPNTTLNVTNSTFSGNVGSTTISGGAIRVGSPGTVATISNSTIVGNSASMSSGLQNVNANGGTAQLSVRGTIVAGNTNASNGLSNCGGPIATLGNNIESGTSCAFTGAGDLQNTNPQVGPLADNGGPTQTRALLIGSPARDAGPPSGCPATDQTGATRPQEGNNFGALVCDIGAVEAESAVTCSPRPPVQVVATRGDGGRLNVTLRATGANNRILSVRYTKRTNAVPLPFSPLTGGTEVSFQLGRIGPASSTLELVIVDRCGEWSTFVGGGGAAF